ncbi:unnamed protein product [Mucor fragilis]
MPKIQKILREQKLAFGHCIKFKVLYNVHLVGVKTLGTVSKADTLSSTLKETKPLALQLSKLQRSGMDAGHASRTWDKTNKALDWDLYSKLKEARKKHDTLWATVSSMKAQIKQMSFDLYILSKRIHGQQEPQAAVTCFNHACPKRLKRHTTMNRDRQEATNNPGYRDAFERRG